jgi:UDP-3-O-[3-hydroxymyristoyl] N-acetylglucosamine deacetylase
MEKIMSSAHSLQMNQSIAPILIVDDEESIRRSLSGVLQDEGYTVLLAADGEQALAMINDMALSLVLLDIWMPGMDGIETLKKIKEINPELPVVMISGHATIATAMTATKLGALDFIEKPLDLYSTVHAVRAALQPSLIAQGTVSQTEGDVEPVTDEFAFESMTTLPQVRPIVFEQQACRGEKFPQRTLARGALMYGQGLHSGKKSGLQLEPLPENSGIHFVGVSHGDVVPAHVDYVESTGFATTVRLGRTQAGTIEHLMSALHVYGISNLLIKCNGEVPVMDGSALEFCALFDEVGVVEQAGDWYSILLDRPVRVERGNEFIAYEPGQGFSIEYTLRYPAPVGEQRFTYTLTDSASFKEHIAPARTFGFVKDIGYLQKQGLALGGRFDNFVLIGENGSINDALRFPDEPVRHKILDCIGDLYLLGRRISGKITASMTGHSDNIDLLKKFRELMV